MTTHSLTDLELTLLSILGEGVRYDHEIEGVLTQRQLTEWLTLGASAVGYGLDRLTAHGLISRTPDGDAHRCTITEAGRGVLYTAVMELIGGRRPLTGLALGLAALHVLKPPHVWQALNRQRAELRSALVRLSTLAAAADPSPLVTYEIAVMQAELTWLEAFLHEWQARYPDLRDTGEALSVTAGTAPTDTASPPTLIHRRTAAHRNKQVQTIPRPVHPPDGDSPDGGSSQ